MINLEPTNLLADALFDLTVARLKYRGYSEWYIYQKFIREN